ncbi:MAG: ExbD/TolR family protein [Planctomycetota bacterium]
MATYRPEEAVKMDMTPMIDCIFQLIIFFFLIIDLQNQALEALVLPKAKYAVPDEPPPGFRPIINILQDGTMIYRQKKYYEPEKHKDNYKTFKELLEMFAGRMEKKMDKTLGKKLPDEPLLIRADKWTEMHWLAKVMEICGDKDVLIWRVQLAVGENVDKKRKKFKGQ